MPWSPTLRDLLDKCFWMLLHLMNTHIYDPYRHCIGWISHDLFIWTFSNLCHLTKTWCDTIFYIIWFSMHRLINIAYYEDLFKDSQWRQLFFGLLFSLYQYKTLVLLYSTWFSLYGPLYRPAIKFLKIEKFLCLFPTRKWFIISLKLGLTISGQ
jgi:hypothetical protein